jgi:hypothetical protein
VLIDTYRDPQAGTVAETIIQARGASVTRPRAAKRGGCTGCTQRAAQLDTLGRYVAVLDSRAPN